MLFHHCYLWGEKRAAHSILCPKSLYLELGFLIASQILKVVVSSAKDFDNTTLIVVLGTVIQAPLPVIAARADLPTLFVMTKISGERYLHPPREPLISGLYEGGSLFAFIFVDSIYTCSLVVSGVKNQPHSRPELYGTNPYVVKSRLKFLYIYYIPP